MSERLNQTGLGVRDAFDSWLAQHDISFPTLVEDAVYRAVSDWLAEHSGEITEAVSKRLENE